MNIAVEPIGRMQPYGIAHLIVLALTVLAAVALIWWARRDRANPTPLAARNVPRVGSPSAVGTDSGTAFESASENTAMSDRAERILRIAGWITLAVTVLWTLWGFLPGNWNINESLPFHFSDAARLVTAVVLITRAGWSIVISYFWGLTLNMQSMLTPDLNYFHVPALEFVVYWFLHVIVLLVPIVFVWGFGYRPTWQGYAIAYAATVAWAGIALAANAITGANYAYLSRAPAGTSILDILGPWPVYIFWEAVLVAAVWALMTWPWEGRRGRRLPYSDGLRTIRHRAS